MKAFVYLEKCGEGFHVCLAIDRRPKFGWYYSAPLKNGRLFKDKILAENFAKKYMHHSMRDCEPEYIGLADWTILRNKITELENNFLL